MNRFHRLFSNTERRGLRLAGVFFTLLFIATGCDSMEPEATCADDPSQPNCDTTPPRVIRAEAVNDTRVTVSFDEALDPASVTAEAFDVSGVGVPGSAVYRRASQAAELTLPAPLDAGSYTVTVQGVRDVAGNALSDGQTAFRIDDPAPEPDEREVAVGAAYPNAADSRIILINKDGDRFVYWNPIDGSFSQARGIDELENGQIPFSRIGAAASTLDGSETYFFNEAGDRYTIYERDSNAFDEAEDFGDDSGDFGEPDIEDVGAAVVVSSVGSSVNPERIFFFNKAGTRYQAWDYEAERWSRVYNYVTDFNRGGSPIASVGAAAYVEREAAFYLFNREGTEYTIYSGGRFSDDFDIEELGDGTLSFD